MQKEIKVSFYAYIEDSDIDEVRKAFHKCGAEIIGNEFPELEDIGKFSIECDPLPDSWEE